MYGESEAGCWLDSCRGRYIGEEVISIAREHGWKYRTAGYNRADLTADGESYYDAWDAAEEHMQKFAARGFVFGANEFTGDWGLWAIDDGGDEE